MKKLLPLICLCALFSFPSFAQTNCDCPAPSKDTCAHVRDSIRRVDSIAAEQRAATAEAYKNSILQNYQHALKVYDSTYSCGREDSSGLKKNVNVTGDRAYDTLFKPILSNVFIGSNDLVQDGPAGSFTQDPEKGTLSANITRFLDKERYNLLNIGVFSKATDGVFGIYTTGSWSSEIGVNISWSMVHKRGRFFWKRDCEKLTDSGKRQRFYAEYLARVGALARMRDSILCRYKCIDDTLKNSWNTSPPILIGSGHVNRLAAEFKTLDSLKKQIELLTPGISEIQTPAYYADKVDSVVAEFEIKNDIFNGYKILWSNFHASLSNNNLTLNTDSLDTKYKIGYDPKNLLKLTLGWNISRISESQKYGLRFFRFTLDFGLHNYADHPTYKKLGVRYNTIDQKYDVYDNNATYTGDYNDLQPNIVTFEPSFYGSWFFLPAKIIGGELRLDSKIPFLKPDKITKNIYPGTYSVVIGPAFRLKKEGDISKGTVGVEVGIMDAPVTENAWRFFAAKLKIGVPFSALIK